MEALNAEHQIEVLVFQLTNLGKFFCISLCVCGLIKLNNTYLYVVKILDAVFFGEEFCLGSWDLVGAKIDAESLGRLVILCQEGNYRKRELENKIKLLPPPRPQHRSNTLLSVNFS